jgi:hypothetical protein
VTPSEKPLLQIDAEALRDALAWLPAGTPITAQSAAKAVSTVSKCAKTVNLGPQEFGERLRNGGD